MSRSKRSAARKARAAGSATDTSETGAHAKILTAAQQASAAGPVSRLPLIVSAVAVFAWLVFLFAMALGG